MLDSLSEKLSGVVRTLSGQGKIRESNIQDALKDVRNSLLEADVNFKVVKELIERVKQKALGAEVWKSLTPSQQFVQIFYDELKDLMGGEASDLDLKAAPPVPVLMVGLQGSGKTTTTGKLGKLLKGRGRRVLLVPADVYRPAAIDQLKTLGLQLEIDVYPSTTSMNPVDISRTAVEHASKLNYDVVLIDTAGRLAIDEEMMGEVEKIKAAVQPREILLVADAMTGQDAVNTATKFDQRLGLTGVVLTKLDGDARGGAALSIKAVTGKPIKFVGVGEKLDGLEVFHPDRMAQRILGMGDVLTLVEKAQEAMGPIDEKKAAEQVKKLKNAEFTLEDFLEQMKAMKKLGSLESVMGMLPGMGQMKAAMKDFGAAEDQLKKFEAIIHSMTPKERRSHSLLNGSRRKRIAAGSGTTVQDVNALIKQFDGAQQVMKRLSKGGFGALKGLFPGFPGG
jgi:signal recognition particle subunit SRP54